MTKNSLSYLLDFRDYAVIELDHATTFTQIGAFATALTLKANQLNERASTNKTINLVALQTEMFQAGGMFIKEFSLKFRVTKLLSSLLLVPASFLFRD